MGQIVITDAWLCSRTGDIAISSLSDDTIASVAISRSLGQFVRSKIMLVDNETHETIEKNVRTWHFNIANIDKVALMQSKCGIGPIDLIDDQFQN